MSNIVPIETKINQAIEMRLGKFVREIQIEKTQQKKLDAYQKACRKLGTGKKKNPQKHKTSTPKRPSE